MILEGLCEHWGTLNPLLNLDLNDIAASYAEETFLVAILGNEIVGTGALISRGNHIGEIVRMSVKAAYRRQGIGRKLLDTLVNHAEECGFEKVILETTSTWENAVKFYLRYGFKATYKKGGNTYFELGLTSD